MLRPFKLPRRRISLCLEFPPFVPAPDVGVTDALNVNGGIWVHLASPLDGFSLGPADCAGPFRTWYSHRVIPLLAPFDIHRIRGHATPPSLRVEYTKKHRWHHIELAGDIRRSGLFFEVEVGQKVVDAADLN